MNDRLLGTCRLYYAQSVFNSKCHFKAFDRLQKRRKTENIVVSVFASITILLLVFHNISLSLNFNLSFDFFSYTGMLLTGFSFIYSLFNKDDHIREMCCHQQYAEKYKSLRDDYMTLIEEVMSDVYPEDQIRSKSETLMKRYISIGEVAPYTTGNDYKITQISLGIGAKKGEEFTWSDDEINRLLPVQLRYTYKRPS